MNLSAIKASWINLQSTTSQADLNTPQLKKIDLTALRSELITLLDKLLSKSTDNVDVLVCFSQKTALLEGVIPQLGGKEQAFYAKLYRICTLVIDHYADKG